MDIELVQALKLTVSVGGDERHAGRPLYREVLGVLRECGVAGATLTRGVMSFGATRHVHSNLDEVAMENLPVVIEAVDEPERVEEAAGRLARILGEHGLVQLQPTRVCRRPPAAENKEG